MINRIAPSIWIYTLSILVLHANASYAQEVRNRTYGQDLRSAMVADLMEKAEDADIEKVTAATSDFKKWKGYILAVDKEALYMLSEDGDNNTHSDTLRVLQLSDVVRVSYRERVGVFPLFTLALPAVTAGIWAEGYNWRGNAGFAPVLAVVMLPIGLIIDGIVGELDGDESWTWLDLQKNTRILREHALYPEGLPKHVSAASVQIEQQHWSEQ
ncbi:MAG: hypothetical protein C0600_06420 [Ignavibacteria bacterium]|nr:MAG: hypothetical protein C0600_06420 [Ignavibacteria bacterium]